MAGWQVNVLLTVHTEFWPFSSNDDPVQAFERDVLGRTATGEFGLPFQIKLLNSYGLKAVFFVESLAASFIGLEMLARIVTMVQDLKQLLLCPGGAALGAEIVQHQQRRILDGLEQLVIRDIAARRERTPQMV